MKLSELKIGDWFRYEYAIYLVTSPHNRLIRKVMRLKEMKLEETALAVDLEVEQMHFCQATWQTEVGTLFHSIEYAK